MSETEVVETQESVSSGETTPEQAEPAKQDAATEAVEQTQEQVEAPKYTPNFKFRYASKESKDPLEKEFDEFIRPAIKDEKSEKAIREIYEKAYGLDFVKPHYQETRQQYQAVKQEHEALTSELRDLGGAIAKGDLDSAFKTLNISDEALFKYVEAKLQYRQLPAEEKAKLEQQKALEMEHIRGRTELQQIQQNYQQTALQLRTMQLDMALGNQNIRHVAEAIDSRLGKGAFKQRVIQYGASVYAASGKDLSPDEAVAAVMKEYEPFLQGQQQASAAPVQKKTPVIPNLAARSGTPTAKTITSIDQLKQKAKEMQQQNLED